MRLVGPLDLRLVATPPLSPGPGELLVAPDAVGVCATDLELLSGEMAYLRSGFSAYPIVPGHEWTGIVLDAGSGTDGFAIGDRIVGECSVGCCACELCISGRYHLCPSRTETGIAGRPGALATTMVFPSRAAHRVPPTISAADAALVEPLAVAFRALSRLSLRGNTGLAVVGAGTIGALCALVARALGARDVLLLERSPERRRIIGSLGLTVTDEASGPFDAVIEASGTSAGVTRALDLCGDGGSVVLLGLTGVASVPVDTDAIIVRDLTVHGSLGSANVWPQVIALLGEGSLVPSQLVTHELALDEVATAFDLARQPERGVGKVLIRPNSHVG